MAEEKSNSEDLFQVYYEKIQSFLQFDELNLRDAQLRLASTRHYWVGRMIHHKNEINKLKKARKIAEKKIRSRIEEESIAKLNIKTIVDAVSNHDIIQKIDSEITNNELLVDYLSRVESTLRDAQFGMNNLSKIIALETT